MAAFYFHFFAVFEWVECRLLFISEKGFYTKYPSLSNIRNISLEVNIYLQLLMEVKQIFLINYYTLYTW